MKCLISSALLILACCLFWFCLLFTANQDGVKRAIQLKAAHYSSSGNVVFDNQQVEYILTGQVSTNN